MSTEVETHSNDLLFALRIREVPGRRIAEALAEVHSHVSETGENPREAFGPAREYADELVGALGDADGPAPLWRGALTWRAVAHGLGGAVGAWLLLDGILALGAGGRGALGLPAVVPPPAT